MKKTIAGLIAACFVLTGWIALPASSRESESGDEGIPSGIVWYGVLNDGIAEAKATGKPIMLLSAAPQCAGVPGMW